MEKILNDECILCLENTTEVLNINKRCKCKIIIHNKCFYEWIKNNEDCPLCRKKLNNIYDEHYSNNVIVNVPQQIIINNDNLILERRQINIKIGLVLLILGCGFFIGGLIKLSTVN